ncbi:MAG: hypothetical protein IMZ53_14635 [Thermoplasmata archaeon]|nr:hypothetical protein [Thermoplasmata archaeon]
MPEIIVKKSPHRINPRDPQHTDPMWEKRREIGEKRLREGKFKKFENEFEKKDYMRKVESSPSNVPGIPVFYPPLTIRSAMNDARPAVECECGGCSTYRDNYTCPRCGRDNSPIN